MPRRGRQRSALQVAASMSNFHKYFPQGKENRSQSSSPEHPSRTLAGLLSNERAKTLHLKNRQHNLQRKLNRSTSSHRKIREEHVKIKQALTAVEEKLTGALESNTHLRKDKDALRKRLDRSNGSHEADILKSKTHRLKEKGGIISESSREMLRELGQCSVPVGRVNDVIQAVSRGLGVEVKDSVDKHSVARIIREGGVAAEMQAPYEIHLAQSMSWVFLTERVNNTLI